MSWKTAAVYSVVGWDLRFDWIQAMPLFTPLILSISNSSLLLSQCSKIFVIQVTQTFYCNISFRFETKRRNHREKRSKYTTYTKIESAWEWECWVDVFSFIWFKRWYYLMRGEKNKENRKMKKENKINTYRKIFVLCVDSVDTGNNTPSHEASGFTVTSSSLVLFPD